MLASSGEMIPSSYGYRPGRRAHDAIAEIVHFAHAPSDYEWVIEADIATSARPPTGGVLAKRLAGTSGC